MVRFGQLLSLLRRARSLQDIPLVGDKQAFRNWVIDAAELIDDVGNHTDSDADDKSAQLLRAIASSPEAWSFFYRELVQYVGSGLTLPSLNDLQIVADHVEAELDEVLSVWMILSGAMRLSYQYQS